MKKTELIDILVNEYGYEKEDIKLFTNAKLEGLIKQEESDAKELEIQSTRLQAPKSKIKDDDRIVVMNGMMGNVGYYSERTNRSWHFTEFGQQDAIEYGELVTMRNKYPRYFTESWIIILDKEVQEEFKLTELYKNILTPDNIDDVFNMDIDKLDKFIDALPESQKTTFVNKAMEKYENDSLESIKVIKYIQEKFNFSFQDNAPLNDIVVSTDTGTQNIIYIEKR